MCMHARACARALSYKFACKRACMYENVCVCKQITHSGVELLGQECVYVEAIILHMYTSLSEIHHH